MPVCDAPGMADYRDVNRANWDERVPAHAASPDYAVDRFTDDPAFLSGVVSFDLPRLGDIAGLDGVHLQCHIGTDTVSLARLGARMTGLDFSPAALEQGRRLAAATGVDVDFVESDLYGAPEALGTERFDLVYTGIGAICWLPDIRRWANVVATLLRPGGRLFMREGHPVLWSRGRTATRRPARDRVPVLRAGGADGLGRGRHVRRDRRRVHAQRDARVEPRPRRDRRRRCSRRASS